jgi:hypothetical protein
MLRENRIRKRAMFEVLTARTVKITYYECHKPCDSNLHGLRVCENRLLKWIFGFRWWVRKLHN